MATTTEKANAYQIVTDRITALLEQGTCPWVKPWAADEGMPRNLFTQKRYRGINVWLLGAMSYSSPFWCTFNQARNAGGTVRKGEKATPIVFWKVYEKETDIETERRFTLRYYSVFNAEQLEGVAIPVITPHEREHSPLQQADDVVEGMPLPPRIAHGGSQAFYRPSTDSVHMPEPQTFHSQSAYYATLFHELGHSTGHESRLKRESLKDAVAFGTPRYAAEELIAEMTAAYLCGHVGIDNDVVDNSAAYIKGWLHVLRDDPKMLVRAAGQAERAANYILNIEKEPYAA